MLLANLLEDRAKLQESLDQVWVRVRVRVRRSGRVRVRVKVRVRGILPTTSHSIFYRVV